MSQNQTSSQSTTPSVTNPQVFDINTIIDLTSSLTNPLGIVTGVIPGASGVTDTLSKANDTRTEYEKLHDNISGKDGVETSIANFNAGDYSHLGYKPVEDHDGYYSHTTKDEKGNETTTYFFMDPGFALAKGPVPITVNGSDEVIPGYTKRNTEEGNIYYTRDGANPPEAYIVDGGMNPNHSKKLNLKDPQVVGASLVQIQLGADGKPLGNDRYYVDAENTSSLTVTFTGEKKDNVEGYVKYGKGESVYYLDESVQPATAFRKTDDDKLQEIQVDDGVLKLNDNRGFHKMAIPEPLGPFPVYFTGDNTPKDEIDGYTKQISDGGQTYYTKDGEVPIQAFMKTAEGLIQQIQTGPDGKPLPGSEKNLREVEKVPAAGESPVLVEPPKVVNLDVEQTADVMKKIIEILTQILAILANIMTIVQSIMGVVGGVSPATMDLFSKATNIMGDVNVMANKVNASKDKAIDTMHSVVNGGINGDTAGVILGSLDVAMTAASQVPDYIKTSDKLYADFMALDSTPKKTPPTTTTTTNTNTNTTNNNTNTNGTTNNNTNTNGTVNNNGNAAGGNNQIYTGSNQSEDMQSSQEIAPTPQAEVEAPTVAPTPQSNSGNNPPIYTGSNQSEDMQSSQEIAPTPQADGSEAPVQTDEQRAAQARSGGSARNIPKQPLQQNASQQPVQQNASQQPVQQQTPAQTPVITSQQPVQQQTPAQTPVITSQQPVQQNTPTPVTQSVQSDADITLDNSVKSDTSAKSAGLATSNAVSEIQGNTNNSAKKDDETTLFEHNNLTRKKVIDDALQTQPIIDARNAAQKAFVAALDSIELNELDVVNAKGVHFTGATFIDKLNSKAGVGKDDNGDGKLNRNEENDGILQLNGVNVTEEQKQQYIAVYNKCKNNEDLTEDDFKIIDEISKLTVFDNDPGSKDEIYNIMDGAYSNGVSVGDGSLALKNAQSSLDSMQPIIDAISKPMNDAKKFDGLMSGMQDGINATIDSKEALEKITERNTAQDALVAGIAYPFNYYQNIYEGDGKMMEPGRYNAVYNKCKNHEDLTSEDLETLRAMTKLNVTEMLKKPSAAYDAFINAHPNYTEKKDGELWFLSYPVLGYDQNNHIKKIENTQLNINALGANSKNADILPNLQKPYLASYTAFTSDNVNQKNVDNYISAIGNTNTTTAVKTALTPIPFDASNYTVKVGDKDYKYSNPDNWQMSRNTNAYDTKAMNILKDPASKINDQGGNTVDYDKAQTYMQNRIHDIYSQDLALQAIIANAHQQTKEALAKKPIDTDAIAKNQSVIQQASAQIKTNDAKLKEFDGIVLDDTLQMQYNKILDYSKILTKKVDNYDKSLESQKLTAKPIVNIVPADINQYIDGKNGVNTVKSVILSTDRLTNARLTAELNLADATNNYNAYSNPNQALGNPYKAQKDAAQAQVNYYNALSQSSTQANSVDVSASNVATRGVYEINGKFFLKAHNKNNETFLVEAKLDANGMPSCKSTYTVTPVLPANKQDATKNDDGTFKIGDVTLRKAGLEGFDNLYVDGSGKYYNIKSNSNTGTNIGTTYAAVEQKVDITLEMERKVDGVVLSPVAFTSPTASYTPHFTLTTQSAKDSNGKATPIYQDSAGNKYSYNIVKSQMEQVTIDGAGYATLVKPMVALPVGTPVNGAYNATTPITTEILPSAYIVSSSPSMQSFTRQQALNNDGTPMLDMNKKNLYYFVDANDDFYTKDGNSMIKMEKSQDGKPLFHEFSRPVIVPNTNPVVVTKDVDNDAIMHAGSQQFDKADGMNGEYWKDNNNGKYYVMTTTTKNGVETYSMQEIQVTKDASGKVIDIPDERLYSANTDAESSSGSSGGGTADNKTIYERVEATVGQRTTILAEYAANPNKENCQKVEDDMKFLQEQKNAIMTSLEDNFGVLRDATATDQQKEEAKSEITKLKEALTTIKTEETNIQTATTEALKVKPLTTEQKETLNNIQTAATEAIAIDAKVNDDFLKPLLDFIKIINGNNSSITGQLTALDGMQTSLDNSQAANHKLGVKIENANTIKNDTVAPNVTQQQAVGH